MGLGRINVFLCSSQCVPQESLLINSPKDDTYDLELLSNSDESLLVLALSEGNCGCSAHPECHEHFMSVLVMLVVMVQWCEQNSDSH